MFGFSGQLRWLFYLALFNFVKAASVIPGASTEDHQIVQSFPSSTAFASNLETYDGDVNQEATHNVKSTAKTKRYADFEENPERAFEEAPIKRSQDFKPPQSQFNGEVRDLGWWPWTNALPPVRRSYFMPRLGKRNDEASVFPTGNDPEFTPAEEEILDALRTDQEEEENAASAVDVAEGDDTLPRSLRSSQGFVPRLGKKAYSFSPRLGKRAYSFSPRLGKRMYSFSPRLGKKAYSFSPRLGKKAYSFSPRLGKKASSFSPRLGRSDDKRTYSFSPRLG